VVFVSPPGILHKEIAEELGVAVIGRNSGHWWEQIDLPFYMARQHGAPLLNLANTAPLLYGNNFVTIHDLAFYHHPEWNSKKFATWYYILIPRVAIGSKHIFTVSQTIKQEIIRSYGIAGEKISITYNGISQSLLDRGQPDTSAKRPIILSVGTFSKRKNHQNLIRAFLESPINQTHQLVIVGDKNAIFVDTGLDEAAIKGGNIKVIATLPEGELIALYREAEVLASLSVYEGFGIPLLEGIYNKCKILCSDIPVYRELYEGFATFCSPHSIETIEQGLLDVVHGSLPADARARHDMLQRYNYTSAAKTILDQITRVLK
jgi:glycosyltransferase involved in cell wall biosynthesis